MKLFQSKLIGAVLAAGMLGLAQAGPAYCQDTSPDKSEALLQKVKQGELDRRIAIKKTEIDRLNEDLDKSKQDMDAMQKSQDATAALIAESNSNLDQLADAQKRLEQTLDLTVLQIEAERKKSDGLKSLSAAQSKALDAINQRMAEMDVRSQVRQSEVQLLSAGKPVPGEDSDEKASLDLDKLKKTLAANEIKTLAADKIAREAMKSASAKLLLADDAASRVTRMSDQMKSGGPVPSADQKAGLASAATPTPATKPKSTPSSKSKSEETPKPKTSQTAKPKESPSPAHLTLFP